MPTCRVCFLALSSLLCVLAQSPESLLHQFREAVLSKDLTAAAELATRLDDAVQHKHRAALVTDADDRLKEVLSWLPLDTETFFFMRSPVRITAERPDTVEGNPAELYTTNRLMEIGDGRFYKALSGRMIRLAAAGMRNMRSRTVGSAPGMMPDADDAYFYFLDSPVQPGLFGPPDGSSGEHPVWKGKVAWLALIRPDILLLASTRDLLNEVLARVATPTSDRALPDTLPEWAQVNPHASFWGLRHYARPGDPRDSTNPLRKEDGETWADTKAIGITMQFFDESDDLELSYLTASQTLPQLFPGRLDDQFKTLEPEIGVYHSTTNVRARGNYRFHAAIDLLGFGLYTTNK